MVFLKQGQIIERLEEDIAEFSIGYTLLFQAALNGFFGNEVVDGKIKYKIANVELVLS